MERRKVFLRVEQGELTVVEAAEGLELCERQFYRIRCRSSIAEIH